MGYFGSPFPLRLSVCRTMSPNKEVLVAGWIFSHVPSLQLLRAESPNPKATVTHQLPYLVPNTRAPHCLGPSQSLVPNILYSTARSLRTHQYSRDILEPKTKSKMCASKYTYQNILLDLNWVKTKAQQSKNKTLYKTSIMLGNNCSY